MDIAKTSLQLVAFEQRPRPRRSEEPLGRSDCRKRGKMAVLLTPTATPPHWLTNGSGQGA